MDSSYFVTRWSATPRLLFRLGPLILTATIVGWSIVAADVWGRHYNNWTVKPLLVLPFVLLVWHAMLCVGESRKALYIIYMIVHLLSFVVVFLWCLMLLTGDSL